jgi:hypothetical protein
VEALGAGVDRDQDLIGNGFFGVVAAGALAFHRGLRAGGSMVSSGAIGVNTGDHLRISVSRWERW